MKSIQLNQDELTRRLRDEIDRLEHTKHTLRQALRDIAALTTNDEHSCYDTLALIQKVCGETLANT
jgi:hypothetical protein